MLGDSSEALMAPADPGVAKGMDVGAWPLVRWPKYEGTFGSLAWGCVNAWCCCKDDAEPACGPGEPARLRRDAALFCRLRLIPPAGLPGLIGAGEEMPARELVEIDPAFAVKLRALVLDDVR